MVRTIIPALAIIAVASLPLRAQNEALHWYFGERSGLDFSGASPAAKLDSRIDVEEGCASVADPLSGRLLFYTDGLIAWDADHNIMPGSAIDLPDDDLWWRFINSTTQSALVVPFPDNSDLYYVFNPGNWTASPPAQESALRIYRSLSYALVDLSRRGGRGDIVERRVVQPNIEMTEKLTGTALCSHEEAYWVLCCRKDRNQIYAFRIDAQGLDETPVVSVIETSYDGFESLVGQMKISPDGSMLAFAGFGTNKEAVELYDFDAATGVVGNARVLRTIDAPGIYGVAFSPDNSKLYAVSGFGPIYQFDLSDRSQAAIQASAVRLQGELAGAGMGSAQLAPDGKIYIAQSDADRLLVINEPNRAGLAADLDFHDVQVGGLGGGNNRISFGLPNYLDHIFSESPSLCNELRSDFEVESVCEGECAAFVDRSTGGPTEWEWTFEGGEPASWRGANPPPVCYDVAGEFSVRLLTKNERGSNELVGSIRVNPLPAVDAGDDLSVCAGVSGQLQGSGEGSYLWTPAEGLSDPTIADPIVTPLTTTEYTLTITDANGCSNSDQVLVQLVSVEATVNEDLVICEGERAALQAGGGVRYEWSPPEGLSDPFIPNPLAKPDRSQRYTVRVFNEFDCVSSATVLLTVESVPEISISEDVVLCRGESVRLQAAGGLRYEWTPADGLDDPNSATPRAQPRATTEYSVRVVNAAGCVSSATVSVLVNDADAIGVVQSSYRICEGGSVQLEAFGGEAYEWSPAAGLSDPSSAAPLAAPEETTVYSLRSWNAAGCVSTATVEVEVRPYLPVTLTLPNVEGTPGDEIPLPLEMSVPEDYLPARIEALRLDLRYDARLLTLRSLEDADLLARRLDGNDEVLTIELRDLVLQEAKSPIMTLQVMALIAQVVETPIRIDNIELTPAPGTCLELNAEQEPGRFAIHAFCLGYNIGFAPRLQLQVQPNPAREFVSVQVRPARDGDLLLRVVNPVGRTVLRAGAAARAGTTRQFDLATADLPAGLYYVLAENGGQLLRAKLLLR